jgi:thioredoxin 1
MSLQTNLKHLESDTDFEKALESNENVMVTCGRMGPMCIPVYDVMESLQNKADHVAFFDMNFDGPAAHNIKSLPEVRNFTGLPFVVYFKNGQVTHAVSSIQNNAQIKQVLDSAFAKAA